MSESYKNTTDEDPFTSSNACDADDACTTYYGASLGVMPEGAELQIPWLFEHSQLDKTINNILGSPDASQRLMGMIADAAEYPETTADPAHEDVAKSSDARNTVSACTAHYGISFGRAPECDGSLQLPSGLCDSFFENVERTSERMTELKNSTQQETTGQSASVNRDGAHPYSQRQAGPTTWSCWSKGDGLGYK